MTTAIYKRVSSKAQDTAAQAQDLDVYRRQLEARGEQVQEYSDKFTGKTMRRPGWDKLWKDVCSGKIDRIIVWRLDRLGRTVSGLATLFEDMLARKVSLVSLRDGLDLATPAGRLMAHVLASVAVYEVEVKSERQLAGIAAAQADIRAGKRERYGSGRKPGLTIAPAVVEHIRQMKAAGEPISTIATVTGLSRPTVYKALAASSAAAPVEA